MRDIRYCRDIVKEESQYSFLIKKGISEENPFYCSIRRGVVEKNPIRESKLVSNIIAAYYLDRLLQQSCQNESYISFPRELLKMKKLDTLKINNNLYIDRRLKELRDKFLNLTPNWDNEGSIGLNENTIKRIEFFLKLLLIKILKEDIRIPLPLILPVPDGSIDIAWKQKEFKLRITIPQDPKDPINIYGEKFLPKGKELDEIINDYDNASLVVLNWFKKTP